MKRVICLLLIACFMVVALASCGGDGAGADGSGDGSGGAGGSGEGVITTKPTDKWGQEDIDKMDVTKLDFDGDTLTILLRNQASVMREWYTESETPDEVDAVVEVRNSVVAEALNIDVQYSPVDFSGFEDCRDKFIQAITDDVSQGTHAYDVVANYAYVGAMAEIRNYIANLADTEVFPYFNFNQPCWNKAIVKSTMINDNLYYITGDLNLSTFDKTMVVFLNKDLYAEKGGEGDLQDLALEGYDAATGAGKAGGFTYDDLFKWSTVADGATHDDFHAIYNPFESIPLDALPYAWDLEFIKTNSDGSHKFNITGNNKIEEAVVKARDLFSANNATGVWNQDRTGGCELGGYSEPISHFTNGKTLFAFHVLFASTTDNLALREMTQNFGLLPIPKYDEKQVNYGTTAQDSYTLITVLNHDGDVPTKGEMVSAYLQYSSEMSYTDVRGYYIEAVVKQKYFGTSDSVAKSTAIFNCIASNVEFDFLSIYAPQLDGVLNSCWRNVVRGSANAPATSSEAYSNNQASFDEKMDEVDKWLGLK